MSEAYAAYLQAERDYASCTWATATEALNRLREARDRLAFAGGVL